jgi:hypothetical protein
MSRSIWTECGASSRLRALALPAWRAVESQTLTSTRKLVDSDDEQAVLEDLIEGAKPPVPEDPELAGLHFLLYTPFRYPPLRHGSRFGSRTERGIWYGSRELRTVFAEVAYYRLLFLEGAAADLGSITIELSAFQAQVTTKRGADLTLPPFAAHTRAISSRTRYDVAQRLGREMRGAGVAAFLYVSARDPEAGSSVGLFRPCFARPRPTAPQTWVCTSARDKVELSKKDVFRRQRFRFPRSGFEVDGRLPSPAL